LKLGTLLAVLILAGLASWLALAPNCLAAPIKSPSEFLGKEIGGDGVLADYAEISRYYTYLASASGRIKVLDLGETTLGRRLLMAVATDPANMPGLDRYREITRTLRDARGVSDDQARALAREGKVIVLDMSSIHSDEIAATQMALDLAYRIASGDQAIVPYLKDVILLIMPSTNPDGHDMTVEYYKRWKGTEYDGGAVPYLYHPYAGHDNNRDWYMFNLRETRLISQVMYDTWVPQVVMDHHQMWMTGARLFVPPYSDPVNPNLDPLLWREIELVSAGMHLKLQEDGLSGVIHSSTYPGWWEGAASMTPMWHNIISILTEAASCRIATPVYVDPSELGAWGTGFPKYTRLANFPDPWPGGWWHLKDIMNYDLAAVVGAVQACSRNKEPLLENVYRMSLAAIAKGETEKPYAYVVPPSRDEFTRRRMIERLMLGGVEVNQATSDFVVDGRTLPAGSYIIFLSQPYRPYAKDMLERQFYPEIRIAPEAPPLRPYDATAWTMPLKMGVDAIEVANHFDVRTQPVKAIESAASTLPASATDYLAVSRRSLGAYCFANRALKARLALSTVTAGAAAPAKPTEPGTILVALGKNPGPVIAKVRELAAGLGLEFTNINAADIGQTKPLKQIRIGVFAPYLENEPFGWLKFVLEDFGFEYKVLRNEDIKRGRLAREFDVVIMHDLNPGIIKDGKPVGEDAEYFEPVPTQYSGGIGDAGIKALKAFLDEGGTLVASGSSCDFALASFELPARNILKDVKEHAFSCPGAILKLATDPSSEICWGLDAETPCLFFYSAAFSTRVPYGKFARAVVARYADHDLLMSGWINGADMIAGMPAVVKLGYGKGTVLIFGFDPIHRAQTYSTYKLLFNAILASGQRG